MPTLIWGFKPYEIHKSTGCQTAVKHLVGL